MYDTVKKEKAFLVIIEEPQKKWPTGSLAEELKNLVLSTGIEVKELFILKIREITPSLYIGKGKAEEIAQKLQDMQIDVVIFNDDLSSAQQRNLEDVFSVKTIDRTQLILDIFANHAKTQEGILQVELAQLDYLLPRLKGKGIMLSRLGGGIGTRGPGEKKIEVDRRKILEKITRLKKELKNISQHREVMRKKRQKEHLSICSLVGYTNAGKTTLFNSFTKADAKISSSMFTTLDTVSRIVNLNAKLHVLFTDTVGFLYNLPHTLIESFKATLEELTFADVLLHVIDSSSPDIVRLMFAVNSILKELGLASKPTILVFNKIDKISDDEQAHLKRLYPEAVFISGSKKINLDSLEKQIYNIIFKDMVEVILKFPFKLMEVVDYIHKNIEVLKTNYQNECVVYWVKAKKENLAYLAKKGVKIEEV